MLVWIVRERIRHFFFRYGNNFTMPVHYFTDFSYPFQLGEMGISSDIKYLIAFMFILNSRHDYSSYIFHIAFCSFPACYSFIKQNKISFIFHSFYIFRKAPVWIIWTVICNILFYCRYFFPQSPKQGSRLLPTNGHQDPKSDQPQNVSCAGFVIFAPVFSAYFNSIYTFLYYLHCYSSVIRCSVGC